MAKNIILLGAQWGDEGKGKIVDLLTAKADAVVRFQGGHNAGHTLLIGKQKAILHLIPSGIFHPKVQCLIGNGVVIAPQALLEELATLEKIGVKLKDRLKISLACQLLLPYHELIDKAREKALGKAMLGTTGRGIGPAYEDKAARRGIRLSDLLNEKILTEKLKALAAYHNFLLKNYYQAKTLAWQKVLPDLLRAAKKIKPFLADVSAILNEYQACGKKILFEGAQGTLLDIDHGTYPFVTSSNTTAGSAATGSGVSPLAFDYVLGVIKAYTTRVGAGPFPTELKDKLGAKLADRGMEFGATTGRARRCGWLDFPALRRAKQINGLSGLALTKLDVLDGFAKIRVCVAYRKAKQKLLLPPIALDELNACKPIYEELPGWQEKTSGINDFGKLPKNAKRFIRYLEKALGLPIVLIATGPERNETIVLERLFYTHWQ